MTIFAPSETHQVFFNYRGEELRYSFVSHLIDAFERHGINIFVDEYEQRGKDLKDIFVSIEECTIALAIFSPGYTQSSWCMDELAKMHELVDKKKIQVIPIFYKVRARDVMNRKGVFGKNFWKLAADSDNEDQISAWMKALKCISHKMGVSLKDERSEAAFVKKIVKEVEKVIEAGGRKKKTKREPEDDNAELASEVATKRTKRLAKPNPKYQV